MGNFTFSGHDQVVNESCATVQDRSHLLGELAGAETYTQTFGSYLGSKTLLHRTGLLESLSASGATPCIDRRLPTLTFSRTFFFFRNIVHLTFPQT